jgi:hypothetical protein
MVGAGSVVTKDVPPFAVVVGNPARIIRYVQSDGVNLAGPITSVSSNSPLIGGVSVTGAKLYELPLVDDMRGTLVFGEHSKLLPFIPKRFFLVFDVPSKEVRGEHAHRACHQFLVCIKGGCSVVLDDGVNRAEVELNRPNLGLHICPMVWATEYKYSSDAVLLVLASDVYEPEDYIRDYSQFIRELQSNET